VDNESRKILAEIKKTLEKLSAGKQCGMINSQSSEPALQGVLEQINELIQTINELTLSATVDSMTSLYNRTAGLDRLETLLKGSRCSAIHCVALIDLNGLKTINDRFGHHAGDYALRSVALTLQSSVRSTDTVCRYGGDEFLIVFKNCTEDIARKIIVRICGKLDQSTRGVPYTVSFSYGLVAFRPDLAGDVSALLELADQRMYANKRESLEKGHEGERLHVEGPVGGEQH
jgi:diguanylate cyclase (GGDEF)-like protein